jgi:ATPase subunit of ABC transporter with duplicated ATPase domains
VRIERVSKGYGKKKIYDGFDLTIRRKERWCVMGENGAGKTTLLKLIAGQTEADAGSVTIGAAVKLGYFSQHAMDLLDAKQTVWDTLIGKFPLASIGQLRALAGAFGFSGDDIEKPVRILSGGEKARVVLALMLYDPPNLLVLDEPTNHLDMATKDMLVGALTAFEGTMVFVSHDRRFLAALSDHVLELGSGTPRVYGGGYNEYVAQSGHEAPGMRERSGAPARA